MIQVRETATRRGGPLAVFALLAFSWVGARALLWESPFPVDALLPAAEILLAENEAAHRQALEPAATFSGDANGLIDRALSEFVAVQRSDWGGTGSSDTSSTKSATTTGRLMANLAAGHQLLWLAGMGEKLPLAEDHGPPSHAMVEPFSSGPVSPTAPVFEEPVAMDRWSLDAWAFWRQGSNATLISQGRVPIYGASQIGANLQYRIAPSSPHDPRGFVRAYRALVSGGETELAAGVSARPVGALPLRALAEVRVTENDFGREVRPAAMIVTELAPQNLPAGFRLEAYGGAGYVGGDAGTPFADGQLAVTRELAEVEGPSNTKARLSVGAGAWGGAQEGANRVDLGPTVRLDLTIGSVPARLSVDWRERVRGDAAPDSGIAATLSTRF